MMSEQSFQPGDRVRILKKPTKRIGYVNDIWVWYPAIHPESGGAIVPGDLITIEDVVDTSTSGTLKTILLYWKTPGFGNSNDRRGWSYCCSEQAEKVEEESVPPCHCPPYIFDHVPSCPYYQSVI